mmetsp:Transcript_25871/g.25142  ORF Transcript_25871/g.25142 Transcript_25871/m.25142 type:complete len:149 (-) Transcript_25871:1336-1782(-)
MHELPNHLSLIFLAFLNGVEAGAADQLVLALHYETLLHELLHHPHKVIFYGGKDLFLPVFVHCLHFADESGQDDVFERLHKELWEVLVDSVCDLSVQILLLLVVLLHFLLEEHHLLVQLLVVPVHVLESFHELLILRLILYLLLAGLG